MWCAVTVPLCSGTGNTWCARCSPGTMSGPGKLHKFGHTVDATFLISNQTLQLFFITIQVCLFSNSTLQSLLLFEFVARCIIGCQCLKPACILLQCFGTASHHSSAAVCIHWSKLSLLPFHHFNMLPVIDHLSQPVTCQGQIKKNLCWWWETYDRWAWVRLMFSNWKCVPWLSVLGKGNSDNWVCALLDLLD